MKTSYDNIWNRARDLLAYTAVPQLNAPPRAPFDSSNILIKRQGARHLPL